MRRVRGGGLAQVAERWGKWEDGQAWWLDVGVSTVLKEQLLQQSRRMSKGETGFRGDVEVVLFEIALQALRRPTAEVHRFPESKRSARSQKKSKQRYSFS